MAQTKKKRRKKHKGTQGGRIDTSKRRAKPRSRAEAKAQARSRKGSGGPKVDSPPTWRNSALRGFVAAVLFAALLMAIFKRPVPTAFGLAAFMLIFYIPAGYYIDMMMWRKRERSRIRAREEK